MDPISVIGLLVELCETVEKAVRAYNYICLFREAPEDMRRAKVDIDNHLSLLYSVRGLVQENRQYASQFAILAGPNGALELANRAIIDLLRLVGGDASNNNPLDGVRRVIGSIRRISLTEMNWTLKRDEIKEALQRLEAQKTLIAATLSAALVTVVTDGINEIRNRLSDLDRKRIINHCLPPIPAMPEMHSDRMRQQEPETCTWVLREEYFRVWLDTVAGSRCRFLCIHGIPGAGKTVLASSIIEKVAMKCRSRGYSYYYCLYSRNQDETMPFLKWVLRMLCRQAQNMVPRILEDAYENEAAPSVDDLLQCLEEVSQQYENGVYIIVDAADESIPRDNLVKVLSCIGTNQRFQKVSLLMTSREENEIMEPIRQLGGACALISMSNKNVREDLRRYVHKRLINIPEFGNLENAKFLEEVERTLTLKANGMFRWAVCQLDVLRRIRGQESIRKALETLPRDIFETYERILVEILQEQKEFVRTALALICSDTVDTAEDLVSACRYSVPFGEINAYNVRTLKSICGSLISISRMDKAPYTAFTRSNEEPQRFHRCSLAHYTVKEYLFSPDIANGEARFFALSDQIVGNIDLKVIFTGLSHFERAQGPRGRLFLMSRYEEYCLRMTQEALKSRCADIIHNEDLRRLVWESLNPKSPHFPYLEMRGTINIVRSEFPTWSSLWQWEITPKHPSTGILMNIATLQWRDLARSYLESPAFQGLTRKDKNGTWNEKFKVRNKPTRTLLGYCLREKQFDFLRIFVEYGRASFEHEPEALYTAMYVLRQENRSLDKLEFLLKNGADPNPNPTPIIDEEELEGDEFAYTPLQLAVYMLDYEWIELLLEEGADVNATGAGNIVPSISRESGFEPKAWEDISQRTCLDICTYAQPPWINDRADQVSIRNNIKELLKRHGAEEIDEDIEMHDDSGTQDGNAARPVRVDVDLTGTL